MSLKQRMPFLRSSFWRLGMGLPRFIKTGQIGDGREEACADYVEANARRGDVDDVIATIDQFANEKSMLINVGDEKGELLDAAVRRANPGTALELGTYCGYGSLRIARAAPSAEVFSVEFAAANAEVARRIWAHADVDDRVTCVVGTIGDGGQTLDALTNEHGFGPGRSICCSSTTTKTPICRICRAFSTAAGCIPDRSSSPTTSAFPAPPNTANTCVSSRASCGTPSSTRRIWSTRRSFPTSCWSRSI